ncbi:MAG: CDP-alcohol phosphatidyltransferase family protein [Clostridia bacterium]|nr:CDP-alcohol phosphatidyltransferase family protein [Clostridia bacterium]
MFIFASVTDLVDGFIARRFNLITDIGKIADPIADKLLQVSTLLCLTLLGKIHMVFPIIFFIKESYMVLGGSCIVKIFKSEYVIQSNIFGKCATCLNSLGIVLGFFVGEVNRAYDIAVNVILVCGAVFAITTAGIYTMQFIKFRKDEIVAKKVKEETQENVSEEIETSLEIVTDNTDNKVEVEKVYESTGVEVEEKVTSENQEASND